MTGRVGLQKTDKRANSVKLPMQLQAGIELGKMKQMKYIHEIKVNLAIFGSTTNKNSMK